MPRKVATIWPYELVKMIACRRAVLFFGAGVSMNSFAADGRTTPPSWADFLKQVVKSSKIKRSIKAEIQQLIDSCDFLTAAEVIERQITSKNFQNELKRQFDEPGFKPAPIHTHLFKLDLRICLTPNIDRIFETSVSSHGTGALTVKTYDEDDIADALRRHERVLIKTHGTVSKPSKVVFTRSGYARSRNEHAEFYELIDALIRTHTLIFIGCGLDDPDIRSLLENYRYKHPMGQNHYFVTQAGNVSATVRPVIEDSMKISIIEYQISANHVALTEQLGELVLKVESERNELAANQTW